MHGFDADTEALGEAILTYAEKRMRLHPVPLDGPKTFEELQAVAGNTITAILDAMIWREPRAL